MVSLGTYLISKLIKYRCTKHIIFIYYALIFNKDRKLYWLDLDKNRAECSFNFELLLSIDLFFLFILKTLHIISTMTILRHYLLLLILYCSCVVSYKLKCSFCTGRNHKNNNSLKWRIQLKYSTTRFVLLVFILFLRFIRFKF